MDALREFVSTFEFRAPTAARLFWYSAHIPLYWGLCALLYLFSIGKLTPAQEKKNKVSRGAVAMRVVEVQISQLVSYLAIEQLNLMPHAEGIRYYALILFGLIIFDLVEYVMHRLYHHRLLYKRVHKAHHLLWCPYPYSALYNSTIEYTITGAVIFLVFRVCGYNLMELVAVNLLGTVKTIWDHTWKGTKDEHHWIHHEVNINTNFEQPWTDIYDRMFGTKFYGKVKK